MLNTVIFAEYNHELTVITNVRIINWLTDVLMYVTSV